MANTPEERAREQLDELLAAAGWVVQDRAAMNLGAARGVAVREFPLAGGEADYLLFADRKAVGAIEAKKAGVTLSGVEAQSAKYGAGLPPKLPMWRSPLPFLYESTGTETYFTDGRDPEPRSRCVFAFHRPETLRAWAEEPESLRARLRGLPPLDPAGMWAAQVEAVTNLERSLAQDRPRALIQMATGSGKTFTAVSALYRLLAYGKARRVLFLVDRGNLGKQAYNEFATYATPDDGRKFTELYTVQRLTTNAFDAGAKVCIMTIQRLYAILEGRGEYDPVDEEASSFDPARGAALDAAPPRAVRYNPAVPVEFFDLIVTDECHRSIYNLWRQVLEYFDAHIVGLTATPAKQTFGFFNQNLVMEYPRERAVVDGVNVDGQVYRIRTRMTEEGGAVDAFEVVGRRDRQTRRTRWEQLDSDFTYEARHLDRDVVSESQIRTVIRAFRDRLFTELFPERTGEHVPKTLIFAKDDGHAEEIVRIVRDEFGKGNDFCQKITYRVTGVKPDDLISAFRNRYNPRIAVTVDMIATGTDVKPIEALLFMRTVKSRVLFEQMLGRGTRVIKRDDLIAVTPDATEKTRFVLVDAVGAVEEAKGDGQTLERRRSVSFAKLLESVAIGMCDDDDLRSLAGRLARLENRIEPAERTEIAAHTGGKSPRDLARALLDATDADAIYEAAQSATGGDTPDGAALAQAAEDLRLAAVLPLENPALRETLRAAGARDEQTLDVTSVDEVRQAGWDADATDAARDTTAQFRAYIEAHRDEIAALDLLYRQPYGERGPTLAQIKDLAARLAQPPRRWTPESLWQAYALLERNKVRGAGGQRVFADLVSLVRHAVAPEDAPELVPYPDAVRERYERWLAREQAGGRAFTPEQRGWLDRVAAQIGVDLAIDANDLRAAFGDGDYIRARRAFGGDLPALLDELNRELVA